MIEIEYRLNQSLGISSKLLNSQRSPLRNDFNFLWARVADTHLIEQWQLTELNSFWTKSTLILSSSLSLHPFQSLLKIFIFYFQFLMFVLDSNKRCVFIFGDNFLTARINSPRLSFDRKAGRYSFSDLAALFFRRKFSTRRIKTLSIQLNWNLVLFKIIIFRFSFLNKLAFKIKIGHFRLLLKRFPFLNNLAFKIKIRHFWLRLLDNHFCFKLFCRRLFLVYLSLSLFFYWLWLRYFQLILIRFLKRLTIFKVSHFNLCADYLTFSNRSHLLRKYHRISHNNRHLRRRNLFFNLTRNHWGSTCTSKLLVLFLRVVFMLWVRLFLMTLLFIRTIVILRTVVLIRRFIRSILWRNFIS